VKRDARVPAAWRAPLPQAQAQALTGVLMPQAKKGPLGGAGLKKSGK
jgi:hypothetical protein